MKKILKVLPEILITLGVAIITGLIIYLDTVAGLFSLGVILVVAGFLSARAREQGEKE